MNQLYYPVLVPVVGGILTCLTPKKIREFFAVFASLATLVLALSLFPAVSETPLELEYFSSPAISLGLRIDFLALVIITLISFLGFLATLFSLSYMKEHSRLNIYYCLLLIFIGSMIGTVAAGDLFTLFLFWEVMTFSAFFLVMFDNQRESIRAAIKYFVMTEAGALCMLLSIIGIFCLNGTLNMAALAGLSSEAGITHLLLLGFLIGAGVKAGMVPLHTWLPDAHPAAPSPVSALLSGVMIKVGIYLMIRVFCQFGAVISWQFILCALGSLTIIIGVMMALAQHDAKRLLAYHSVSQIGYMLLGIGTGVAVGVAGGLFHLINHALFKGLLFLCIGAVIYRMKTRDLSELGGLGRFMPLTFAVCLIAALSISGVPPFNGFVSKWMVYQGIIQMGTAQTSGAAQLWPMWLVAAIFGSALTLASFVKLIHSIFLSRLPSELKDVKEVSLSMKVPMVILASLCVFFGIFYHVPLKLFIYPALNIEPGTAIFGTWESELATVFIIIGVGVGLLILAVGWLSRKSRVVPTWTCGEVLDNRQMTIPGTHFYKTVSSMAGLKQLYTWQENGRFDLYNQAQNLGLAFIKRLRSLHSGILPTYLTWVILGLLVILPIVCGIQILWGSLLIATALFLVVLLLSILRKEKKMKKLKVTFEIEGTLLADMFHLNEENLEKSIFLAFDEKDSSPLFDDNLDATVRNLEIEEIA
jgi:proton-translocating NADH-quinone oxidoreductase chain M